MSSPDPQAVRKVAEFVDHELLSNQYFDTEPETLTKCQNHVNKVKALEDQLRGAGLSGMRWKGPTLTMFKLII